MPVFQYTAYGLHIVSQIECPELLPDDREADVTVRYGQVPSELENARTRGDFLQVSPGRCLLAFERTGRYLVRDGREIIVDPTPNSTHDGLRLMLLGPVLVALLHQRGMLALHGSAIETPRGAAAFLAPSGFGKSTLVAAFERRGYRVLADDLCAVVFNASGIPLVLPAFPQIKLWEDAAMQLGQDVTAARRLLPTASKYGLPLKDGFAISPVPLRVAYVLAKDPVGRCSLSVLRGKDKLLALIENTHRLYLLEGAQQTERHFAQCVAVARYAAITRLTRPAEQFAVEAMVALVEHDLASQPGENTP
jgi:hypothetical protein